MLFDLLSQFLQGLQSWFREDPFSSPLIDPFSRPPLGFHFQSIRSMSKKPADGHSCAGTLNRSRDRKCFTEFLGLMSLSD